MGALQNLALTGIMNQNLEGFWFFFIIMRDSQLPKRLFWSATRAILSAIPEKK
jgi:hypothetical protein